MQKRRPERVHAGHSHSFLQIVKNYINEIVESAQLFFRQYLKPEGKQVLINFNRLMVLPVFMNIEFYNLLYFSVLLVLIIKLIKLRPWDKSGVSSGMPLSYLNWVNHKNRLKDTLQKILDKTLNQLHQKLANSRRNMMLSTSNTSSTDKIQVDSQNSQSELPKGNLINKSPQELQRLIYEQINRLKQSYCNMLWFVKWKTIFILFAVVLVAGALEPTELDDNEFYLMATVIDGELQIESIQSPGDTTNEFLLMLIWINGNLVLFYWFGKSRLEDQLFKEIYEAEYSYGHSMKISKFKSRKIPTSIYTKGSDFSFSINKVADDNSPTLKGNFNIKQFEDPRKWTSVVFKKKKEPQSPSSVSKKKSEESILTLTDNKKGSGMYFSGKKNQEHKTDNISRVAKSFAGSNVKKQFRIQDAQEESSELISSEEEQLAISNESAFQASPIFNSPKPQISDNGKKKEALPTISQKQSFLSQSGSSPSQQKQKKDQREFKGGQVTNFHLKLHQV